MKILSVLLISIIIEFTTCEHQCEKIGKKFESDIRALLVAKDFDEIAKHLSDSFTFETYDYKTRQKVGDSLNKKQFMEKLRKGEIKMFELPEDDNKMMKCDMRLLAYRDVDGKLRYRYNLSENQNVKAGSQMDSLEQSVLN